MDTTLLKKIRTLSVIALATAIFSAPADAGSPWQVPSDGFLINLSTPNGIPQKSGQTTRINGTITWTGGHLPVGGIGWGDSRYNSQDLNYLLQQDGLQIQGFFPDATTNITSGLQLSYSRDGIDVQYTTPALQTQVPSALTLVVSHQDPINSSLQQIAAKLNVRIAALQSAIAQLQGKKDSAQDIAWLQSIVTELQAISARINQKILASNEVLAEEVFPLQVDDIVAGPSMNSSLIEPFRFTVSYDLGSAIEGESTTAHGIILRDPADPEPGQGSGNWIARFFWNNQQVKQLASQKIAPGAQVEFDYPISDLDPSAQNTFAESMTSGSHDDGGFWNWNSWWTLPNFFTNQSGGALAFALPVEEDKTPPVWLAGSSLSNQPTYAQSMNAVSATLQDSFGLVNSSSIVGTLTGTTTSGTSVNNTVTSSLSIITPDQGQTYNVTGNLNPLADGVYTFALSGEDLAGNKSVPDPLRSSFRIDTTPPQITLSQNGSICTSATSSNFTVSVFDWSPLNTSVSDNGTQVLQNSASPSSISVSQAQMIPVRVALAPGNNSFSINSTDAAGNTASSSGSLQILSVPNPPAITLGSSDNVYTNQAAFSIPISVSDAGTTTTTVMQNGAQIASSTQSSFTVNATLSEGVNTFTVQSTDCAGNTGSASLNSVVLDTTPPVITLGVSGPIYTKNASFSLPVTVVDIAPTMSTVILNGATVEQSSQLDFDANITLQEGANVIQVDSVDAAGYQSTALLSGVTFNNVPPMLANYSPAANSVVTTLSFPVSVSASEPLASASVNGLSLTLASNGTSASGEYTAQAAGPLELDFSATDLEGNVTSATIPIQIVLNVLTGNLISVSPNADGVHLNIQGAVGAAEPGVTVNASAGFFNTGSAVAADDGSFLITMSAFTQATLTATDPTTNITNTVTVTYGQGSGTLLSGTVRDTSNNPLANATVSLAGSSAPSVVTDGNGVFTFTQPVTGNQTLVVDGSAVLLNPGSPAETFSKVAVSINIGLSESNVLKTPIYLAPIPQDGSAPTLTASGGGQVTDPNAPGVSLNIPAGVTTFPGGVSSAAIAMSTISSQYSTIPPLKFIMPGHVTTLEPSGTTFSAPVQLTLPNTNQLPPGVQMVIMSMDSTHGVWTVDGVAQVSDDGSSVVTKPGQGITHFSVVYATPIGPMVFQTGAEDEPGADTFDGSLTNSIKMPSYRSLGQAVTPQLLYKSAWAYPTALITNMFDIPNEQINYTSGSTLNAVLNVQGTDYYTTTNTSISSAYTPQSINAQFTAAGITGSEVTLTGIPNQAEISYAITLQNPSTGAYLQSGVYPYDAHYQINLADEVIATQTESIYSDLNGPVLAQGSGVIGTTTINQVFPEDMTGLIYVQNKIQSPEGRGWMLNGAQTILNPTGNRVAIEEADGSISTYSVDNNITTVFSTSGTNYDLTKGTDVRSWPNVYLTDTSGNVYSATSQNDTNLSGFETVGVPFAMGGTLRSTGLAIDIVSGPTLDCPSVGAQAIRELGYYTATAGYTVPSLPLGLLGLPSGTVFGTDSDRSVIFQAGSGSESLLAGSESSAPTLDLSGTPTTDASSGIFIEQDGSTCPGTTYYSAPAQGSESVTSIATVNLFCADSGLQCGAVNWGFDSTPCSGGGNLPHVSPQVCSYYGGASTGQLPDATFNGDGSLTQALNSPTGIAPGPTSNTIVIADTGNNRVRLIDLNANTITTVAGNGQNYDNGDGGPATSASIYQPEGVAYDSVGNLYISSKNGFIRKVDTTGMISTFAGNANGTTGDSIPATQLKMSMPTGMAIDNDNGYLYVADTGSNYVWRIDFQTQTAVIVAGTGSTTYNGDNQSALSANLNAPQFVGVDPDHNLIIVDSGNQRIRKVVFQSATTGTLAYSPTTPDLSTLTRNSDGSFTRVYRNGTQVSFDLNGHETYMVDRVGRQTQFSYNGNGNLTSITDPTGQMIQYTYAGNNLSAVTDPAGRTTYFSYDGYGNLTKVSYPNGTCQTFTYNANGLMLSSTDQDGHTTEFSYNQWGRLAQVTRADNSTIAVNDAGSATAANNYTNGQTGQLTNYGTNQGQADDGIVNARSITTKVVPGVFGYITTIIDGNGNTTTVQRDVYGNPVLITRPDNTTVTFTYDPNTHDLLSQTDSATGITVSETYDSYGNLLTQTNGKNYTASTSYTSTELVQTKTDANGNKVTYSYTPLGQVASITNGLSNTSTALYDARGNMISRTDGAGRTSTMTYDSAGNVLTATDPAGRTYSYQYDSFNRLVSATTPKDETTTYTYSPTGMLTQIRDAQGNITTMQYDVLDQMSKKTDPLGYVTTYAYDGDGNVIQKVDPSGNNSAFTYDNIDELTQETFPDNTLTFAYDSRKHLLQAANQQSVDNFTYDDGGRLISAQSYGQGTLSVAPSVTLNFGWDLNNNRISMSDPTGTTSYTFDPADRLTAQTNPFGQTFTSSYDAANRVISQSRPGSQSNYTWDNSNLISEIIHSNGTPINQFIYSRDQAGNITGVQALTVNRTLAYDADTQLVSATNPEAPQTVMQNESYTYDSISNRTQDEGGNYTYGPHNQRVVQDYRYTYYYDNNGNLSSKQEIGNGVGADGFIGEVTNYFYSSQNQLLGFKVYPAGSNTPSKEVTYAYDALGRRIQKVVNTDAAPSDPTQTFSRNYVYDGQDILLEYDGNDNLLARYTHSKLTADDVLAVNVTNEGVSSAIAPNDGSYYYLKDALGSVVDVTDGSGNRVQHYVYSSFGQLLQVQNGAGTDITASPVIRTTYTFTGRELDPESGLYYYRARYYDPNVGRFLQKDPNPGSLNIPVSVVNSYAYASNNPVNLTDPTGQFSLGDFINSLIITMFAVVAAIVVAPLVVGLLGVGSALGGGFLGAVADAIVGAVAGAMSGAITGGLAGGIEAEGDGESFSDGFKEGAIEGAFAGAITGAVIGWSMGWQASSPGPAGSVSTTSTSATGSVGVNPASVSLSATSSAVGTSSCVVAGGLTDVLGLFLGTVLSPTETAPPSLDEQPGGYPWAPLPSGFSPGPPADPLGNAC